MTFEKIDELRALLDLPDRSVVSMVMLKGIVETTADDIVRTFAESGDVAFVFVGPAEKLRGERRVQEAGGITYTFTVAQ